MADVSPDPSGSPSSAQLAVDHGTGLPFTPTEQAQLIADDLHAARVVAGLMTLIFALGLVLYIVVLLSTL